MSLLSYLKDLLFFGPDYSSFLKLGYRARTYNGDFILSRSYSLCSVHIHQSIEPYHPLYSGHIDFEIEDACVVIHFNDEHSLPIHTIDMIRDIFDFSYLRGPFLFCMLRKVDFNDPKMTKIAVQLDNYL